MYIYEFSLKKLICTLTLFCVKDIHSTNTHNELETIPPKYYKSILRLFVIFLISHITFHLRNRNYLFERHE